MSGRSQIKSSQNYYNWRERYIPCVFGDRDRQFLDLDWEIRIRIQECLTAILMCVSDKGALGIYSRPVHQVRDKIALVNLL